MASLAQVLVCAGLAALLWTVIGLPVAARLAPRNVACAAAPMLGWAMHSAAALPVFLVLGMSRTTVAAGFALPVMAALAWLRTIPRTERPALPAVPLAVALTAAALLALVAMAAVLPKGTETGVTLAGPIFDHSKIAMIDEMRRSGVPPVNPFLGDASGFLRLPYYYLWHFSAAELALLTGSSGWEADAGLTWFTAFASLALAMSLAVWVAGRPAAAVWAVLLATPGSLRPVLTWVFGPETVSGVLQAPTGFGGWLFQTSWAPQHMAAAACAVLATALIARLAARRDAATVIALALTAAAAFGSSTWIGGVAFPISAGAVGTVILLTSEARERQRFLLCAALAAILALALVSPLLYDQIVATRLRGGGPPVLAMLYPVLSDAIPAAWRRVLDGPAYWLVFLVVEFPAFYLTGIAAAVWFLRTRILDPNARSVALAFAPAALGSLCVAWLLVSTLGDNNDLGWRAVLPGILILIVFAAAGLARVAHRSTALAVAASVAIALGLPDAKSLATGNISPPATPSAQIFAASSAMWIDVRRHAGPTDRVANNPLFVRDMTPWPVNISWALLSDRRSCYAALDLVMPFAPLTNERRQDVDAQFTRVFEGSARPDDVRDLATRFDCRIAVVTAQDGAWERDPFAPSTLYRLVAERPHAWRIYKRTERAQP